MSRGNGLQRPGTRACLLLFFMMAASAGFARAGQEPQPEPQLSSLPSARALQERSALQSLMTAERPEDRLTMVKEFLTRYPDSPLLSRAYLAGAEAYRMLRNFEKAIEYGEKVLAIEPGDVMARILLADALVESTLPSQSEFEERFARAEQLAREAIESLPGVYSEQRRPAVVPPEKFNQERRFIESQPRATLGFIYLRRGEFSKAEEQLKSSIALNELNPNGTDFLRLAYVHIQQSEWEEARVVLDRAFEFGGPIAVAAHQYRAVVEREMARPAPQESVEPEENDPAPMSDRPPE